jgi:hypothetical protein
MPLAISLTLATYSIRFGHLANNFVILIHGKELLRNAVARHSSTRQLVNAHPGRPSVGSMESAKKVKPNTTGSSEWRTSMPCICFQSELTRENDNPSSCIRSDERWMIGWINIQISRWFNYCNLIFKKLEFPKDSIHSIRLDSFNPFEICLRETSVSALTASPFKVLLMMRMS